MELQSRLKGKKFRLKRVELLFKRNYKLIKAGFTVNKCIIVFSVRQIKSHCLVTD